jgi:hypothetical protein
MLTAHAISPGGALDAIMTQVRRHLETLVATGESIPPPWSR